MVYAGLFPAVTFKNEETEIVSSRNNVCDGDERDIASLVSFT